MFKFIKRLKIPFLIIIVLSIIITLIYSLAGSSSNPLAKDILTKNVIPNYVGPRTNIPDSAPPGYDNRDKKTGFWSFAISVDDVLSRSGQPNYENFKWLKDNGWRSVINAREDGEYKELSNDKKVPGFNELNFNYLNLPIKDNTAPTNEQAEAFLNFIINPDNQPAHLHCRAGVGRTGTLVAVYRYSVQGWPLKDALEESKLYNNGLNQIQTTWLEQWATNHLPGEYSND